MLENTNLHSSVAVYAQIENQVQFVVASGQLRGGDQLPTVRQLSKKFNVNPNTVAKAYRDLEVMGILYTRRGMGVFINKGVEPKCIELCRKKIAARLHEVVSEAKAAVITAPEIKSLYTAISGMDAPLYGDVPPGLLAMAKGKKR